MAVGSGRPVGGMAMAFSGGRLATLGQRTVSPGNSQMARSRSALFSAIAVTTGPVSAPTTYSSGRRLTTSPTPSRSVERLGARGMAEANSTPPPSSRCANSTQRASTRSVTLPPGSASAFRPSASTSAASNGRTLAGRSRAISRIGNVTTAGRATTRAASRSSGLPRTGGLIPTLIVSDRPGPGHPTRRYVVREMRDDVDLHGGER